MIPATTPLLEFSGKISWPLGQISLMVTLGEGEHSASTLMNFMVVRSPSPYNGIIGRPGLRKIQAVPSTTHRMLKFPVEGGIVTIRNNTTIPTECRMVAETQKVLPPREPTATEGIKVAIHPEYPEQTKPADMIGVPISIAEHRLNIREGCQPIRQKRRRHAPDRNKAIQEEVAKLVEAKIMREVHYRGWLLNPVMVKKHDGSWRIRRSVHGPCSQHARNQSMSIKIGSSDEATITSDIERSSNPKRKAGKLKQGSSKRGPFDGKGLTASTSLFRQPCLANPINQLQLNGKTSFSVGTRHEEAEEILPSTPDGAFDITYRPRASIRVQVLADFITKKPDEEGPSMEVQVEEAIPEPWTIFTDGSWCLEGSGVGLILTSPEGKEFTYALRFEFDASNNEAEYEALVASLRIAEQMGVKNLIAKLRPPHQTSLGRNAKKKVNRREGNLSSSGRRRVLLDDIVGRITYGRKSFLEPWMRCVGPTQAEYVVKEIHEGSCSIHSGLRSVVAKATRSGYYWPTMHKDARNIIRKCDDCQTHRPVPMNPQQKLTPITSPWLFYKWGIDISGPFPEAQGMVKFLIVAID
ncbi:reverse transcriptase domain-containing protein [Tanacetum coccineum]